MRKLFLLFYLIPALLKAQVTIQINSVSQNTPANATIFIAGSFNNWNAADSNFIMRKTGNIYKIILPASNGTAQFKFTRGSWSSVEGTSNGTFIPNRSFVYSPNAVINCDIAGWEDLKTGGGSGSTANENVKILSLNFFMPQLNRTRKIWIYLPSDYQSSTKSYPVLYMHDGQNVFDVTTSFSGEWGVDEALTAREKLGLSTAIVVAIDNGGSKRLDEYSPFVNPQYGGGEGEAYTDFIVQTLKPFIDSAYRTKPEFSFTGIAGSSMGGLISMYAALKYPMVFGKVGIFSPAFWFSDSLLNVIKNADLNKGMKVYFVSGANESKDMVPDMRLYDSLLIAKGLDSSSRYLSVKTDGAHSEWFWKREFPAAFNFLFPPLLNGLDDLEDDASIKVYPNPASQFLVVKSPIEMDSLYIIHSNGNQLSKKDVLAKETKLDTSSLANGSYILLIYANKKAHFKKFTVLH
ncbi:MAG: alpha/beta hydrolase-fold protein [Bacteroidia bacterium]